MDRVCENHIIECIDREYPGPGRRRVMLSADDRSVFFENCHSQRRFFAIHGDVEYRCEFADIRSVHGLGTGHNKSIIVSTATGRCRIFADWVGYEEMRSALGQISSGTAAGHWSDNPWIVAPTMLIVIFSIVAAIIYALL